MYRVTCQIDFCYGHRLLNYAGKCRYLHGHNGRAVISIGAEALDQRGMVLDFTDIKREVSAWIDQNLDHRMILNEADPVVPFLREMGEPMFLLPQNPTAETIARLIHEAATARGFPIEAVQLWETPRCYATYERDATKIVRVAACGRPRTMVPPWDCRAVSTLFDQFALPAMLTHIGHPWRSDLRFLSLRLPLLSERVRHPSRSPGCSPGLSPVAVIRGNPAIMAH